MSSAKIYTPEEIGALARDAGLVPVASRGDFAEGPLREDSEVQVHLLAHAQEAAA